MKLWRYSIILIGTLLLVFSSIPASAESENDPTGDVYHAKMINSIWTYQPSVDSKPYIDITELTYTISEGHLTVIMEVSGNIQSSDNIAYMAWFNSSDATYQMYLLNDTKFFMGINTEEGGLPVMSSDIIISGDTLTCTIDLVGSDETSSEFWGSAMEFTDMGSQNQEWWGDWIPGTYAPFWGEEGDGNGDDSGDGEGDTNGDGEVNGDNGSSSSDDGGTPGFEVVALFVSLAIAIFVLRRRK